jgi:hypothetical protein
MFSSFSFGENRGVVKSARPLAPEAPAGCRSPARKNINISAPKPYVYLMQKTEQVFFECCIFGGVNFFTG